jgi:hypothetical protein
MLTYKKYERNYSSDHWSSNRAYDSLAEKQGWIIMDII